MIIDKLNEFGDALSITGATGTAAVGDTIDLGVSPHDLGLGKLMYLVVQVQTAVDSAADGASVAFQLVSDAQDPPAADGSETVHIDTGAIAEASLVAGARFIIPLPIGTASLKEYERYLGLQTVISGEAVTAGAVDAFLTFDPTGWKSYADGQN